MEFAPRRLKLPKPITARTRPTHAFFRIMRISQRLTQQVRFQIWGYGTQESPKPEDDAGQLPARFLAIQSQQRPINAFEDLHRFDSAGVPIPLLSQSSPG